MEHRKNTKQIKRGSKIMKELERNTGIIHIESGKNLVTNLCQ